MEILSQVTALDPKDVELNLAKSEIAPQAAGFVSKLNAAKMEEAGKLPISLALYLSLKDAYPASQTTRLAVGTSLKIFQKARIASANTAAREGSF